MHVQGHGRGLGQDQGWRTALWPPGWSCTTWPLLLLRKHGFAPSRFVGHGASSDAASMVRCMAAQRQLCGLVPDHDHGKDQGQGQGQGQNRGAEHVPCLASGTVCNVATDAKSIQRSAPWSPGRPWCMFRPHKLTLKVAAGAKQLQVRCAPAVSSQNAIRAVRRFLFAQFVMSLQLASLHPCLTHDAVVLQAYDVPAMAVDVKLTKTNLVRIRASTLPY